MATTTVPDATAHRRRVARGTHTACAARGRAPRTRAAGTPPAAACRTATTRAARDPPRRDRARQACRARRPDRARQRVRGPDDQRAHHRVRTSLLREALDRRQHGEDEAGERTRARPREPLPDERHTGRGGAHREHGGDAQHQERVDVTRPPEEAVHHQVVQAVHASASPSVRQRTVRSRRETSYVTTSSRHMLPWRRMPQRPRVSVRSRGGRATARFDGRGGPGVAGSGPRVRARVRADDRVRVTVVMAGSPRVRCDGCTGPRAGRDSRVQPRED